MAESIPSSSASAGTDTTHLVGAKDGITEEPDLERGHAAGDGNVAVAAQPQQTAGGGGNEEVEAGQQPQEGAGQQGGQQAEEQRMTPYDAIFLGNSNAAQLIQKASVNVLSNCGPHGQNVLHIAALRSKDLTEEVIARFNKEGISINEIDDHENTPLHYAASVGVKGVTSLLVAEDANMKNTRDRNNMCPIHIAASVGAMDAIRALVSRNEKDDPSAALPDGNRGTFLHVAVKNRQTNVVEFVCRDNKFKHILNTKDSDGNTALHLAVQNRDESNFSHLLGNSNVELNNVNNEGYTPLDLASKIKIQNSFASLQNPTEWMIRVLAHSGAQFSARRRDWNFETPKNAQEHPSHQATDGASRATQSAEQAERPSATQSVSGTAQKKHAATEGASGAPQSAEQAELPSATQSVSRTVQKRHAAIEGGSGAPQSAEQAERSSATQSVSGTAQKKHATTEGASGAPQCAEQERPWATQCSSGAPQCAEQERPWATQQSVNGTAQKKHAGLAASTESVLVASALIATVTFAAAVTVPGSYKTDGSPRAGTPALGRSYGYKVFVVADMLAFFCSVVATFSLAAYGTQWNVDPLVRCIYARRAVWCFHVALKSVIVAFALGVSVVMWDISVVTIIIVGIVALATVLYGNEAIGHDLRLIWVMYRRHGLSRSWKLQPSTSSYLDWDTWWLKSFTATIVWNVFDLSWAYIAIYLFAYLAELKVNADH